MEPPDPPACRSRPGESKKGAPLGWPCRTLLQPGHNGQTVTTVADSRRYLLSCRHARPPTCIVKYALLLLAQLGFDILPPTQNGVYSSPSTNCARISRIRCNCNIHPCLQCCFRDVCPYSHVPALMASTPLGTNLPEFARTRMSAFSDSGQDCFMSLGCRDQVDDTA